MRNECGEAVGAASREAFLLAKSPSLRALPSKLASEFDEDRDGGANTLAGSEVLRLRGGMLVLLVLENRSGGPYI